MFRKAIWEQMNQELEVLKEETSFSSMCRLYAYR